MLRGGALEGHVLQGVATDGALGLGIGSLVLHFLRCSIMQ